MLTWTRSPDTESRRPQVKQDTPNPDVKDHNPNENSYCTASQAHPYIKTEENGTQVKDSQEESRSEVPIPECVPVSSDDENHGTTGKHFHSKLIHRY